jgi:hypothetical protein
LRLAADGPYPPSWSTADIIRCAMAAPAVVIWPPPGYTASALADITAGESAVRVTGSLPGVVRIAARWSGTP